MAVVMALDPATRYVGYAIGITPGTGVAFRPTQVQDYGLIQSTHPDWRRRVRDIQGKLLEIADRYRVDELVSEIPDTWGSARGQKSASSGAVMKLAFSAGMYCGGLTTRDLQRVAMVEPLYWKGQVPKDVVYRRLESRGYLKLKPVPRTDLGYNVSDAIGILVWYADAGRYEEERHV